MEVYDIVKGRINNTDPDKPVENVGYCEYCYQVFPLESLIEETIWTNGEHKQMLFCSKEHASYRQMGAEG